MTTKIFYLLEERIKLLFNGKLIKSQRTLKDSNERHEKHEIFEKIYFFN